MEQQATAKARSEVLGSDSEANPVNYFDIQLRNALTGGVAPPLAAGAIQRE